MRIDREKLIGELKHLALEKSDPSITSSHAAAIVSPSGTVIGWGTNRRKTHPLMQYFRKNSEAVFLHAEIDAIVSARKKVEGSTLVVVRVLKDGTLAPSCPCEGCQRALRSFGVKQAIYTTGDSVETMNF